MSSIIFQNKRALRFVIYAIRLLNFNDYNSAIYLLFEARKEAIPYRIKMPKMVRVYVLKIPSDEMYTPFIKSSVNMGAHKANMPQNVP